MKKTLAALACSLAMIGSAVPAAAQAPEMSEAEATALARFAMPRALQGLQQKCRSELAGDAYIYQKGPVLMGRLQSSARGSWPVARQAIMRMVEHANPDMMPLLSQLPPESLQPFAEEMVAGMVVTKVEPGECGRIDKVLSLLDPLPPENLAALVGFAFSEAQAAGQLEGVSLGGF